jgi:7-carboxy-7-deazaguanine synthase
MKTSEIFPSIQGEGKGQGLVTTFVRLAGCNLRCRWCDTRYAWDGGEEQSVDAIAAEVRRLGVRRVCITGGEPLLQGEDLSELLATLAEEKFEIEIETNGTIDPTPYRRFAAICMDVKCPASGEESDLSLLSRLGPGDSVKFVVSDLEDLRYMVGIITHFPTEAELIVSPVHGTDLRMVADFILERRLPVRLQVQLHKIVGVR